MHMATETQFMDARTVMEDAVDQAQRHWSLVPGSASIRWTAHKKYFMVIPVTAHGTFSQVSGTISMSGDRFDEATASISVPVTSHSSGQALRDKHLLGQDFFHADKYAFVTFESAEIRRLDSVVDGYEVAGFLTVRDTSVPLTLTGTLEPSLGGDLARIALTGSFNRRDVGITWNAVPMLKLDDDIGLSIEIDIERS